MMPKDNEDRSCPDCGVTNNGQSTFCKNCGHSFVEGVRSIPPKRPADAELEELRNRFNRNLVLGLIFEFAGIWLIIDSAEHREIWFLMFPLGCLLVICGAGIMRGWFRWPRNPFGVLRMKSPGDES